MVKKYFICSECGCKSPKWLGKCPECGSWNSFVEEIEADPKSARAAQETLPAGEPVPVAGAEIAPGERIFTGLGEFDRVTGGMVGGQAILISGEPGIGKSTLLLGLAARLAALPGWDRKKIYYVNGEESNSQVRCRAERLGVRNSNLYLYGESAADSVAERIRRDRPAAVFIDSIQTLHSSRFVSQPGSVVQVRETAHSIVNLCKSLGILLFIVGHITKTGSIAGPKVVEHIVDTVLFFEADSRGLYRILRSLKNRFFSTEESGFFSMGESGIEEVPDLSKAFTFQHEGMVSGISLYPVLEGNRSFPVEIQALCTPSQFNYPRRVPDGMDQNRLYMLAAILEKRLKLNLSATDIYLNVTSGLRVSDPAIDLPVLLAIYSSFKEIPVPTGTAVCGEAGLTGEVRPVLRAGRRASEMARLGFKRVLVPFGEKITADDRPADMARTLVLPVKTVEEAITVLVG